MKRGIDRRAFLRSAGATAVLGTVGAQEARALGAAALDFAQERQAFDFDTVFSRIGTDSSKWDGVIADFGSQIEAGMGVADMDFRVAPCVTRALAECWVPHGNHFWFAWAVFRPETRIWGA